MAGSGLVVLICALIMLFGLALNRQRWGNYLTVGGVLICGPGGYMVGALAGDIGWRMLLVLLFVSGVIVTLIQIPSCGPASEEEEHQYAAPERFSPENQA